MFQKLHKFIGKGIKHLVERSDEDYVFRLHKNRVFYVREALMRRATNVRHLLLAPLQEITAHCEGGGLMFVHAGLAYPQIAREKLVHLGTSIGKMTHTGKFRLTVGCLDVLAQHAKYKVGAS